MKHILTPEEAARPVTYGDLVTILGEAINNLSQESIKYSDILQENTFKLINQMTEHIVKIRDDSEYKRQRDMMFVISLISRIGHYDKDALYDAYMRWCAEFDGRNKPQTNSEAANE